MSVYKRGSFNSSRFNQKDYDKYDAPARDCVEKFFINRGWKVGENDDKSLGMVDYDATDQIVASPQKELFYLETEMKISPKGWEYLKNDGIHYTFRKIHSAFETKKINPKNIIFVTVNQALTKLVLTRGEYAFLAWSMHPEYKGMFGCPDSPGFEIPEHGCFPVRKKTRRDSGIPEDFISIDYNRLYYYERKNKEEKFKKVHSSDKKFLHLVNSMSNS